MKKSLKIIDVIFPALLGLVFFIATSMIYDSGSEQDRVRQKGNKKAELLDRLEKGENITIEDLRSAFRNEDEQKKISPEAEEPFLPFYGFMPWYNYDFEFEMPDFSDLPSIPEMPSFPEFPPSSFDFRFRYSDRWDSIPGISDEWNSERFREDISRAMEEARKSFEKFREGDWQNIQEEIRKAMEEMNRQMDELREKYGKEKDNQQSKKNVRVI